MKFFLSMVIGMIALIGSVSACQISPSNWFAGEQTAGSYKEHTFYLTATNETCTINTTSPLLILDKTFFNASGTTINESFMLTLISPISLGDYLEYINADNKVPIIFKVINKTKKNEEEPTEEGGELESLVNKWKFRIEQDVEKKLSITVRNTYNEKINLQEIYSGRKKWKI